MTKRGTKSGTSEITIYNISTVDEFVRRKGISELYPPLLYLFQTPGVFLLSHITNSLKPHLHTLHTGTHRLAASDK